MASFGDRVRAGSAQVAANMTGPSRAEIEEERRREEIRSGSGYIAPPEVWLAQYAQQKAATDAAEAKKKADAAAQAPANALNARFGTDLSWLDPAFQANPALLGQSALASATSDPAAQMAQMAALSGAMGLTQSPLNFTGAGDQAALADQWGQVRSGQGAPAFQGSGAQQGLSNQWAGIQAGQGAPEFMGGAQQEQLMQQLLGVKAPEFAGAGTQQKVLDQILGQTNAPNAGLTFDTSGRQAEQYGNLNDIVKGGGADAIEMARRQAQRADQESWLRGQREADMQDYAERGLTGSGQELLALSSDRQAAAGRNSLADLETAAALEERRLGAINSAAGLATNMRGQTIDEQGLIANKSMAGLGAAASLANSMRGADFTEQAFLNESARQQAVQAAGIAETMRNQTFNEASYLDERALKALEQQTGLQTDMRNQTFNEASYLDKRALDALQAQTDLRTNMRQQQYQEQIGGRAAQLESLGMMGDMANQLRSDSWDEASTRAGAKDQFDILNQGVINAANNGNKAFLQKAYQDMMNNRQVWEQNVLNQKVGAAGTQEAKDQQDHQYGYQTGMDLAQDAANKFTQAQLNKNDATLGTNIGANNQLAAAQAASAKAAQELAGAAGKWVDNMFSGMSGQMGQGGFGGIAGGSAGGSAGGAVASAPSTNLTMPSANLTYKPTGSTYSGLTKADDDDEDN